MRRDKCGGKPVEKYQQTSGLFPGVDIFNMTIADKECLVSSGKLAIVCSNGALAEIRVTMREPSKKSFEFRMRLTDNRIWDKFTLR